MNIEVKLEKVFETKTFDSGFKKREFVGIDESNPSYPQYIKFELIKDACDKIDGFNIGDVIEVNYNIRGNKYENPEKGTQYFVSLNAWKIEPKGVQVSNDANPELEGEGEPLPF